MREESCALDDFTYATYRRFLATLSLDRVNVRFRDFPLRAVPARYFILRHDVDMSPDAALRMAELEASEGIRASYFLLFSSPYYNLLTAEHCAFPRRLIELGHEVGLHYDLGVYEKIAGGDMESILCSEARILGALSGVEVRSIARHHPSLGGTDPFLGRREFINAYDEAFVGQIGYFSDSCGAWRDATYQAFKNGELPPRLQVLIHPLYWQETAQNRWQSLESVVRARQHALEREGRDYWVTFRAHQGLIEHERRCNGAVSVNAEITR